ncbi:MAG: elongation factor P [Alphaproteobacteria bacterium]|nr:elongation factor P [Alphaproteobacteria bacterium]
MYQTSDIKKGLKVEIDGAPWTVTEFLFVKPGKGVAFTRTRLKNLITGATLERSFRTGEKLEPADVAEHEMQYLYNDGEQYHFMNMETFDQIGVPAKPLGDATKFLVEEMICTVMFFKGAPVGIELPNFVELEITYCEPGVKGNTAQGATKLATLSTGAEVHVPLFVEQGEWLKIDTRDGSYVERVKK